jgi:hypothetical protein
MHLLFNQLALAMRTGANQNNLCDTYNAIFPESDCLQEDFVAVF